MERADAIAVIIPVKNRAQLLEATLANLLAQSLPPAQILVVDDASSDNLAATIRRFEGRVTCMANIGQGPGAARNLGLAHTTAPLIQFFDSDDLCSPTKLEEQATLLLAKSADMAYGPYVKARETAPETWKQEGVVLQAGPLPNQDLLGAMLRGWNAITQSMLFRRAFLERVPAWDEHLVTFEDYLYVARLAAQRPLLVHAPDSYVIYRQHGAQSTLGNTQLLARAADSNLVMERLSPLTATPGTLGTDALLFRGRLEQNRRHTAAMFQQAGTEPPYQPIPSSNIYGKLAAALYRVYNKYERAKTGTEWESMHAPDPIRMVFDEA
jgi:glycosyltransferase involved in cell wall biosynthesis